MTTLHVLGGGDHALLEAAIDHFKPAVSADAAGFLASPATIAVVAIDDDQAIGWAHGISQPRVDGELAALLYEIDVAPSHRNLGLGSRLVEAFMSEAATRGCSRVWVVTETSNQAAIALYESAGGARTADHAMFTWQL